MITLAPHRSVCGTVGIVCHRGNGYLDVFIGHNVTFINDLCPKATNENGELQSEEDWHCIPTIVEKGASIGSSATILCGVSVGQNAMVGAGSVVTKDIPPDTIVAGNPAKEIRKID